jgi:outer membrane murein-binding lipoprotein Lpp
MEPISVDLQAVLGEVERLRNQAMTETATLRAHVAALTSDNEGLRAEVEQLRGGSAE